MLPSGRSCSHLQQAWSSQRQRSTPASRLLKPILSLLTTTCLSAHNSHALSAHWSSSHVLTFTLAAGEITQSKHQGNPLLLEASMTLPLVIPQNHHPGFTTYTTLQAPSWDDLNDHLTLSPSKFIILQISRLEVTRAFHRESAHARSLYVAG